MEGTSQLLLDTGALERAARPLLVGSEDAAALLEAHSEARAFFFDETALARCRSRGAPLDRTEAGARPTTDGHDLVVVFHPKGKRRRDWALCVASHAVAEGGELILVGAKREGIGSAKKLLQLRDQRSGRHAKLYQADPMREADPDLDQWESRWETGLGFAAVSLPGTFAEGRLDDGSRLLLEHLELPTTGRLLDLGCGSGVLGVEAKRREPGLEVHLADADHLAVLASERTGRLAGVQVEVHASDSAAQLVAPFDVILLNPPFHEGVKTRASAAEGVLHGAADALAEGGTLWVVANRFLPHEDALETRGLRVERAAATGRFKVLRCRTAEETPASRSRESRD